MGSEGSVEDTCKFGGIKESWVIRESDSCLEIVADVRPVGVGCFGSVFKSTN